MSKYLLNRLSASAIQTFLQCKLKYFYNYFSDEIAIMDRKPMDFGLCLHESLEYIGRAIQGGNLLTEELCKEAVQVYLNKSIELGLDDQALIKEGKKIIMDRMTKHNTDYRIVDVEYKFKDIKTEGGTPLSGFIDIIMEMDQDTALVVDYKSSRVAKPQKEADEDLQMSLYDYVFSKLYPQYSHTWLVLDFLRSNIVITHRSPTQREEFGLYVDSIWAEMKKLTKKDMKPSINRFCNWCGYKHLCDAYGEILKKKFVTKPIEVIDENQLVEEWIKLTDTEKIIKGRKAELKEWASQKLIQTEQYDLESDSHRVYTSQKETVNYDLQKLLPYINIEVLPKFVKINKKDFEKYIENENPELAKKLQYIAHSDFSAPAIRITEKKK